MLMSLNAYRQLFILKLLLVVSVGLGLNSCTKNSDKMVSESLDVKQFNVDQIIERNLNFNEDNLIEDIVLVEGVIQDINNLNNRSTIILKGKKDTDRLVICDMQKNQKLAINNLNLGDEISIKGIFKGTLNDVILLNCIIPQPKTNE
ncbi:hypothetical protein GCM10011444_07340 [Winogradskyella haliclonae]|uniref:tRNA_anti-like n=2 Tax=Winogradskyella haliclonae TaxID=2048558 RepID=A0ABQ2BVE1_9FLAO|nr:hypothetical protein GCM10011444_07340 [Winogradskyella haliclonae]